MQTRLRSRSGFVFSPMSIVSKPRRYRTQGRRNVLAVVDCRCRDSWRKGRRNASERTNRCPRTCVQPSRTKEEAVNSDRWQQEDDLGSSIFVPPRFPAACQRSDPSERTQPHLLAPFIHHELLKHCLVISSPHTAGRGSSCDVRGWPGGAI